MQPPGYYDIKSYYLPAVKEPHCVSESSTLFPGLHEAEYHSAFQRYIYPLLQGIPYCRGNCVPFEPSSNVVDREVFWTSSSMLISLGFSIFSFTVCHESSSISQLNVVWALAFCKLLGASYQHTCIIS